MDRSNPNDIEKETSGARILWITERYPPAKGGMAVSCERMTVGLRKRDILLDVVVFNAKDEENGVYQVEREGGADFLLSRQPSTGLTAQVGWSLVQQRHAQKPYTMIVGFGTNLPGFVAVSYGAWLSLPSLILVRGNDFDRDWFNQRQGGWVREALSRASVIGAVSTEKVKRIKALFPEQDVRFLPNGVDLSAWRLLPADRERRDQIRQNLAVGGRRVVGIFGELKYKKRIPFWLGALRDQGLNDQVGLLVVGRLDEETEQILDDPVLAPLNHRISFCSRDKLPGLYGACDFVAIPSLFDGMPNVLLEAMAAGVIPIVSDAGAMGEVVQNGLTGFLFPAEDRVQAAAVTAKALAMSHDDLAAMAERARDRVDRHFSVEKEMEALVRIVLPGGEQTRRSRG